MTIKRGDIYWIKKNPYRPNIGHVQDADRPAIIISNNINNQNASTFEVVYLTASPKKDQPTHVTIRSAREVSTALCEQITTISDEQIGRYMGMCTTTEMMAIDQAVLISLGIDVIDLNQKLKAKPDEESIEEQKIRPSELDKLIDECATHKELKLYKQLYNDLLDRMLTKT